MIKKFFLLCFLFTLSAANAQNINLTGPFANSEVGEGDEFATDVLGNPWDFSQRRDIGWEEQYSENSINVNGGQWQGTTQNSGAYVFPLFPGFTATLEVDSLPGDKTTPKIGSLTRINADKYYHLSYRLNQSNRSGFAVYWESAPNKEQYWPDLSSPYIISNDGYYHATGFTLNAGYNIYNFNMKSPGTDLTQGTWSGNIYALRLDPSYSAGAGANLALDWLRVYDPSSAPYHTINWEAGNLDSSTVTTIWIDTNGSGYDGDPIARYTHGNNPGTHSFPTAMLPPGDYYFYLTVQNHYGSSSFGPAQYSGYSARLRINARADITITNPTTETGEDYASTQVGNPWNMDSSTDLANLNTALWPNIWRQFSNYSFTTDANSTDGGSVFAATADAPLPGNNESDVGLILNVSSARPINPNKYRYVTYRMWVDPSLYGNISDKVYRGWYSRPFTYWNNNILQDAGYIKGHVTYEGWHTYTADLWKDNILASGLPFRSFSSIYHARIEPGEFDVATNFKVDFLKLTAENKPTNNTYQISYTLTDPENSSFNVDFYYDTDKSGFNGSYIGSSNAVNGNNTYNWDTTGLADGEYYIYLIVNDGVATGKRYASVSIRIGSTPEIEPRINKTPMDYDGDGKTDLAVYRASLPGFLVRQSAAGDTTRQEPWVARGSQFAPIQGDFDGDNKTDYGWLYDNGLAMYGYIYFSSNNALYAPEQFPFSGAQPVIADYDGDGKDELALYDRGQWNIRYQSGTLQTISYGVAVLQDYAVPADYDGDGKADIAVWRPGSGHWFIIQSSNGQSKVEQWGVGLYRDTPVPADLDNDGKADFVILRLGRRVMKNSRTRLNSRSIDPGSGGWFIKLNATGAVSSIWSTSGRNSAQRATWTGDIPFIGDKNGDGVLDLMLFRQQTGSWYVNYRNGTAQQRFVWGRNRDIIPRKTR